MLSIPLIFKKCFLLSGERRVGQVLRRGRRAHGERRRPALASRAARTRSGSPPRSAGCSGACGHPAADLAPGLRQRANVVDVEALAAARRCVGARSLCARNSRNAVAVVANPPGTRMPAAASWLIISPSEAFLPPTSSTSVMRSSFERDDERLGVAMRRTSRLDAPRESQRRRIAILPCRAQPSCGAATRARQRKRPPEAAAVCWRWNGEPRARVGSSRWMVEMSSGSYMPRCRRPGRGSRPRPLRGGGGSSPPGAACGTGRDAIP